MDKRKTGYHWGKKSPNVDGYIEILVREIVAGKTTYKEVKITLLFYKRKRQLRELREYLKKTNPSFLDDQYQKTY